MNAEVAVALIEAIIPDVVSEIIDDVTVIFRSKHGRVELKIEPMPRLLGANLTFYAFDRTGLLLGDISINAIVYKAPEIVTGLIEHAFNMAALDVL